MKKFVSLTLAVLMLMSVMVIGVSAGSVTYLPSRKQDVEFYYRGSGQVAATLTAYDWYYADARCLRTQNTLSYDDEVGIYNMVLYTKYEVTYANGTTNSEDFVDVASSKVFIYTRDITLRTEGRVVDTIVVTHRANPDDLINTGHLDTFTDAVVTATYR